MSAGNVAEGERHREHRQTEGERDAHEPDADLRESGGEHRAAAAAQYEPERAEEFDSQTLPERRLARIKNAGVREGGGHNEG